MLMTEIAQILQVLQTLPDTHAVEFESVTTSSKTVYRFLASKESDKHTYYTLASGTNIYSVVSEVKQHIKSYQPQSILELQRKQEALRKSLAEIDSKLSALIEMETIL